MALQARCFDANGAYVEFKSELCHSSWMRPSKPIK
jgi:hypothetical protein